MTYYTLVATGRTDRDPAEIEAAARIALREAGFEVVPCNWTPDLDTVADCIEQAGGPEIEYGKNGVIDLS